MICNNPNHDKSCPNYKYNNSLSLKGASAAVNNQSKQLLVFNQSEVSIISKVLEISRSYLTNNKDQFQQTEDILNEITTAGNILSARSNNNKSNLKGASVCNETKIKSLQNIRKLFNLT